MKKRWHFFYIFYQKYVMNIKGFLFFLNFSDWPFVTDILQWLFIKDKVWWLLTSTLHFFSVYRYDFIEFCI